MELQEYKSVEILENKKVSDDIYLMSLKTTLKGAPGQFYMLKVGNLDPLLPRPISIFDVGKNEISLLYQVVGKGTEIMAEKKPGDKIEILGPLGNGFTVEGEKVAVVGGGIGIAPLLYLCKKLKFENKYVEVFLGYRTKPYLTEEFEKIVDKVHIATEDGSVGHKGYVTEIIGKDFDTLYSCGPNLMLKSLKSLNICDREYYSLEARMACGISACLGCSIKTVNGMKRVCHEGPIFSKDEVIL